MMAIRLDPTKDADIIAQIELGTSRMKKGEKEALGIFEDTQKKLKIIAAKYGTASKGEMIKLHRDRMKVQKDFQEKTGVSYKKHIDYMNSQDAKRLDKFGNVISRQKTEMENFARYAKHWALRFVMYFAIFKVVDIVKDLTTGFTQYTRELQKNAEVTGLSIEQFQKLNYAAQLVLITTDKFRNAMDFMNKAISRYRSNIGLAPPVFKRLGLSLKELVDIPVEEQFYRIADAFSKQTNASFKAHAATVIFGRGNRDMISMVEDGRQAIINSGETFEKTGALVSKETSRIVEEHAKFMEIMKSIYRSVQNVVGMFFIKSITGWRWYFNWLTVAEKEWMGAKKANAELLEDIASKEIALSEKTKRLDYLVTTFGKDAEWLPEVKKLRVEIEKLYKDIDALGELKKPMGEALESTIKKLFGIDEAITNVDDGFENLIKKMGADLPWNIDRLNSELYKLLTQLQKGKKLTGEQSSEYAILMTFIQELINQGYTPLLGQTELLITQIERYKIGLQTYKDQLREIMQLQILMQTGVFIPSGLTIGPQEIKDHKNNLKKFKSEYDKMLGALSEEQRFMATSMTSSFSDFFNDTLKNAENFEDILLGFFDSIKNAFFQLIADMIAKAIMSQVLMAMLGGPFGGGAVAGAAGGGNVIGFFGSVIPTKKGGIFDDSGEKRELPKFASGGWMTEGLGNIDRIPALLKPKEVVIPFEFIRDFFGNVGEQLFKRGNMPQPSSYSFMDSGGESGPTFILNIQAADLSDNVTKRNIARELVDMSYEEYRRRT